MSTLTDRYVHAVTAQLRPDQRADIAAELRATIEDTVAGRAAGVSDSDAERAAILELGNPTRLADEYRGSGRFLVGPRLYDSWLRVLKALLASIPPIIAVIVVIVETIDEATVLDALVSAIGAGLESALQIAFWVTIGFAIAERTGASDEALSGTDGHWDPDELPAPSERQQSWGEGIFGIVFSVLLIALITVPNNPIASLDGRAVALFTDLAFSLRWVLAAGLVVSLLASIPVLVRGHWTWPSAIANAVGNVLFVGPLAWLVADQRLVDPLVTDGLGEWARANASLIAIAVVVAGLWDAVDGLRKAAVAQRH